MKKFILEYAAYNVWANETICSVISTLTDEQFEKEIVSSFSSIRKTVLHLWDAHLVWINRLEGVSLKAFPSESFLGTNEEIITGLISSSKKLKDLTESYDEDALQSIKKYATFKGGIVTSSLYQVLAHVFNHSTYHRGQLVTMLRQLGIMDIPKTDLIFFYREVKK